MGFARHVSIFDLTNPARNWAPKYRISTPLMIENPVRSPMVPPIRLSFETDLLVSFDLVVGGRVKEDVDKLKG